MMFSYGTLLVVGAMVATLLPRTIALDLPVRRAIVAVYILRTACALGIFALSLAGETLFGPGAVVAPGVWSALPDTVAYHNSGVDQMEAAARGIVFRVPDGYSAFVGLVYATLGAHPLVLILSNSVIDVVTLIGLLVLARRVSGRNPPYWMVWGLGLWPSWVVWSTQVLKESLLLCLVTLMLLLATSILARSPNRREWLRYGFLEWPAMALLIAAAVLVRSAVANVLIIACGLLTAWLLLRSLKQPRIRTSAFAAVALVAVMLQGEIFRSRLYPFSYEDHLRGLVYLGLAYEREGSFLKAQQAYGAGVATGDESLRRFAQTRLGTVRQSLGTVETSADAGLVDAGPTAAMLPSRVRPSERSDIAGPQIVASVPIADPGMMARLWRLTGGSLISTLWGYTARLTPQNVAALRNANRLGSTRFGSPVEESTAPGVLRMLPGAVAHTLFAPFPWSSFPERGSSGALRSFAAVELPWVFAVIVLGLVGALRSLRRGGPDAALIGLYVFVGVFALAVAVPNDGLLFRYRLQFLAPLATFVPSALDSRIVRTFLTRLRQRTQAP